MSDYSDMMFVRFMAEFDRLRRERGGLPAFTDLTSSEQEDLKAAFLRTVEQIEMDLY